jgi:diguanylate cyclase (GGDEF)-like protein
VYRIEVQLAAGSGARQGAPVLPYLIVLALLVLLGSVVVLTRTFTGRRMALSVIARLRAPFASRTARNSRTSRRPDQDRPLPAARIALEGTGVPYRTGSIPTDTLSTDTLSTDTLSTDTLSTDTLSTDTLSTNAIASDAITSGAITMGDVATATGIHHDDEVTASWWADRAVSVLPGRPLPPTSHDESVVTNSFLDDSPAEPSTSEPLRENGFPSTSLAGKAHATPPTLKPALPFELGPIRDPAPADPADPAKPRRTATKKQRALLVGVDQELAAACGQQAIADITTRSAVELVGADSIILVLRSISGPQVLAQYPESQRGAQIWGVRTLGALLMRPDPVRLMMDGDPLADGARTAVLTAPIVSSGDLVGVLVSRRLSARAFTAYDEAAISRLAQICGARLPVSPEREQLLADNMDRVTGLANRELLVNDLLSALAGMVAHGMPATLLVGEVDGLARLRTTQGSVAADVALAELAAKVRVAVRFGDVVYRSGGDELAVLLPATDEAGAAAVGQRLTRLAAGSFESTHPGLSLRTAAVDVEGSIRDVLARAAADLGAARIAERWAAGAKVV